MNFLANLNKNHMMTFLMLSIGSLLLGTEDRSGISNHYYVTDRAFTIKQGGIINVEYGVKQNDSYLSGGLNPVAVEFDGGVATDAVNYGYLSQISNLTLRSWSAWIYLDADPPVKSNYIFSAIASLKSGYSITVQPGKKIQFYQLHVLPTINAAWNTPANSVAVAGWAHIAVTHDITTPTTAPIIYINGTAQALTVVAAPSGNVQIENGIELIIGNNSAIGSVYDHAFDGKIFDPRVYNRILSAAEVTTLYNAGNPDHTLVTDGLVFQGLAVYADEGDDASLAGTVLSSTDRLTENILRAVGIPNGSPTIRANP